MLWIFRFFCIFPAHDFQCTLHIYKGDRNWWQNDRVFGSVCTALVVFYGCVASPTDCVDSRRLDDLCWVFFSNCTTKNGFFRAFVARTFEYSSFMKKWLQRTKLLCRLEGSVNELYSMMSLLSKFIELYFVFLSCCQHLERFLFFSVRDFTT